MVYTVYLRTNKVNGKQYVGQTNNLERRNYQFNSIKCRYNTHLDDDRIIFGVDNFDVVVLAEVATREEAWELEQKYVKEFNTIFPNGYNRAYGGRTNKGGNNGYHNGKEFKKGDKPWNKGVKNCFTEETLKAKSENQKGRHNSPATEFKKGMTSWIKGKHHSEETKRKLSETKKGKASPKRKPVVQLTQENEFVREFTHCGAAAKEMGFKTDESIRKACVETWRTSGGSKWMYKEDYEKLLEDFASQEL